MQYTYTPTGRLWVCRFIRECEAKRKEILNAGIDTADKTDLPTAQDILDDVNVGVGLGEETNTSTAGALRTILVLNRSR